MAKRDTIGTIGLRKTWILVLVIIGVLGGKQFFFPQLGQVCYSDPDHSTEQLLSIRPSGQINVPGDMTIEFGHIRWRSLQDTAVFTYPTPKSLQHPIKAGKTGTASCKARDREGRLWIVETGGKGHGSSYIPADCLTWEPIL